MNRATAGYCPTFGGLLTATAPPDRATTCYCLLQHRLTQLLPATALPDTATVSPDTATARYSPHCWGYRQLRLTWCGGTSCSCQGGRQGGSWGGSALRCCRPSGPMRRPRLAGQGCSSGCSRVRARRRPPSGTKNAPPALPAADPPASARGRDRGGPGASGPGSGRYSPCYSPPPRFDRARRKNQGGARVAAEAPRQELLADQGAERARARDAGSATAVAHHHHGVCLGQQHPINFDLQAGRCSRRGGQVWHGS